MKKLFKFALIFIAISASISLTTSCSSSDDEEETTEKIVNNNENNGNDDNSNNGNDDESDNDNTPESPEDNLPEEARAFVGCWKDMSTGTSNNENLYIFWGDGICWKIYYGYPDNTVTSGYWTFDKATNILATTINNIQWQITLSNTNAWVGIYLNGKETQTFEKVSNNKTTRVIKALVPYWENSDGIITELSSFAPGDFDSSIKDLLGIYENEHHQSVTFYFKEDGNPDDFTFYYYYAYRYHGTNYNSDDLGTMTLKNPTSSTKFSLLFKNMDGEVRSEFFPILY